MGPLIFDVNVHKYKKNCHLMTTANLLLNLPVTKTVIIWERLTPKAVEGDSDDESLIVLPVVFVDVSLCYFYFKIFS